MNPEANEKVVWHSGVNYVIAAFLFVALAAIVRFSVLAPPIDAAAAAVRSKDLADLRAAEAAALASPAWVDHDRGIVRLPIETAIQIYQSEARDPAAARADLIARAQKASAPLPQKPAAPNPFE